VTRQFELFARPAVCFYHLNSGKPPRVVEYFSKTQNVPIVSDPVDLEGMKTVFFSIHSTRDAFKVAKLAKHKRQGSVWIAGGNAATNPTAIKWIMDYVFIGDAFVAFEKILNGTFDLRGMLNCSENNIVCFNDEDNFKKAYSLGFYELSKGCKRKCFFCVNAWRREYKENNFESVKKYLDSFDGRVVNLRSNSSDDVSFYPELIQIMKTKGIIDLNISTSIQTLTDEHIQSKSAGVKMPLGVEGFSERLRKILNKPIKNDALLDAVDRCLFYGKKIRTVYQFNLPGETENDFDALLQDIEYMRQRHKKGSYSIAFIPHNANAFTPMQWEKPYYNLNTLDRILELGERMKGSGKTGLSVHPIIPLSPLGWFKMQISEFVPITPQVAKALPDSAPKKETVEYYIDRVSAAVDVGYVFEEKDENFDFPWDNVKVATDKKELYRHYQKMKKRIERSNT